ncbi:MAG: hypothetical protein ABUS51_02185 [Acidobacteriota bacterium]
MDRNKTHKLKRISARPPAFLKQVQASPDIFNKSNYLLAGGVAAAGFAVLSALFLACFLECFFTGAEVLMPSFAGAEVAGVCANVMAAAARIKVIVFMGYFSSSFRGGVHMQPLLSKTRRTINQA